MQNRFLNRLLSTLMIALLLALTGAAGPVEAQNVRDLGNALGNSGIEAETCVTNPDGTVTCASGASSGRGVAARLFGGGGGGFLQNLFGGIISFFRNLFGGIFGGGSSGGGCTGGDCGGTSTGGGCTGGDCGGTSTGSSDTATVTPGTPATPVPDGEVPSGVAALKSAIRSKFGVTMDGSWNETQLKAVYKTLSVLPVKFRKWNKIQTKAGYRGGLLGLGEVGGGHIWIYGGAFNARHNGTGIQTIVHEMTHNFQGDRAVCNAWRSQIRGRSVSSYGNTNWMEDMAESVSHYYLYPQQMKQTHASRYNFIKQNIMEGREFTGNEWR